MKDAMKLPSSNPTKLQGKNLRIAIILPRFNDSLGNILLNNTHETLLRRGVQGKNITLFRVPGALELPLTAKILAKKKKYDAIIALGVVIKGDTPHFEHVCTQCHRGLMDVGLETETPVIFGVITALNEQQARDRVEKKRLNKGRQYAETAIELANLLNSR